jgi:D-glycero-D-manno-heptose 1,7-bisphosphate phosphatase
MPPAEQPGRPAVFVDRDGVLNDTVLDASSGRRESPYRPEDVALAPGAVAGMRVLRDLGFVLVVISNQPAAAKGTATREALEAVHERVNALLGEAGVRPDLYRYCHHHPDAHDPSLAGPCACRKPEPGLLLDAAAELGLSLGDSWTVGDSDSDVAAGRRAGTRTVLVEHPGSAHRRLGQAAADGVAADLREAARVIELSLARTRVEG